MLDVEEINVLKKLHKKILINMKKKNVISGKLYVYHVIKIIYKKIKLTYMINAIKC